MKITDFLSIKLLLISTFALFLLTCCESNNSDDLGENFGYANAENAIAQKVSMELKINETVEKTFNFIARRKVSEDVIISYKYDESLREIINGKIEKDYPVFPQSLINLSKETVTILSREMNSDEITIQITNDLDVLEENKEYIIPLKANVIQGDLIIPEKDSYIAFIVKVLGDKTDKSTGIKIFSCMEINHANPLNHLNFKLKNSDKYLFDAVILFSANMHYNHNTKKVQISLNEQNRFLFANIEKYVKPLQDEGIKVLFGLTPHGALDGLANPAGISNLTNEECKRFALEIKKFNDKFGLDGILLDDEYGYNTADGPGDPSVLFPQWSYEASSRLAYEIKQVMPDKLVTIYSFSYLGAMVEVEGVKPGAFVDYVLPDYYDITDYTQRFEGIPKKRAGYWSINLQQPWWQGVKNDLKKLREDGYGANMVYGLDPRDLGSNSTQLKTLKDLTTILFDDELVYTDNVYESDWSHLSGEGHKEWTEE